MNSLIYIIGFITLILVITAIHEAGHYSVARFFKVTILDFSIGMGRSLKSWKDKAETEFHLRILPIGGFVKMKGEEEEIGRAHVRTPVTRGSRMPSSA